MATKVFFYTLRPYDELGIAQRLAPQLDVEFGSTQEYPTLENAELAKGYDAVSVTPCDMSAPMVKRFHELGVKSICCRSIGYDHVDRETARELGMKVANVDYPPNGVAKLCHYAHADEPAQGRAHPQARRSAGLLPAGKNRPRYFHLHRGCDRYGPHWPHGAAASVRLWLPPAGLRPVPQR